VKKEQEETREPIQSAALEESAEWLDEEIEDDDPAPPDDAPDAEWEAWRERAGWKTFFDEPDVVSSAQLEASPLATSSPQNGIAAMTHQTPLRIVDSAPAPIVKFTMKTFCAMHKAESIYVAPKDLVAGLWKTNDALQIMLEDNDPEMVATFVGGENQHVIVERALRDGDTFPCRRLSLVK
jgi:hypothetical protein